MVEKLDDLLNKEKDFINKLEAPKEMEARLQKALNSVTIIKKRRKNSWIAAAVIFFMFFTYNFDAIAYYGKKLLGYDEIMNGALQDLNELGRGQEINKSYTFPNGVEITLNGIMFDENRLIAFYSLETPDNNINDFSLFPITMEGLFSTYRPSSGHGIINEEETGIKWLHDFESPAFFERGLTLKFSLSEKSEFIGSGEIPFKLDRSKAMGYTIKKAINETVNLDEIKVVFNSLKASPTMTLVEGILKLPGETRENMKTSRNHRLNLDYDLLANGTEVAKMGGGLSSSPLGLSFEGRFEPLPGDIEDLKIRINKLPFAKNTEKLVNINLAVENLKINVEGNDILLKKLETKNDASYLTIVTGEDVLLEKVYLLVDGKKISLEKTIPGEYEKHIDKGVKITYERTLEFLGKGEQYQVQIERISFAKEYNEVIDIPINGNKQ